jgi:hypothetical protein
MAVVRLKTASFPVKKSLSGFDFSASSVPPPTLEYRPSLEWLRAREWPCLVGPPGTVRTTSSWPSAPRPQMLITHGALRCRGRLVESLYRGLADTSVDKVVESTLRADAVVVDGLARPDAARRARWASCRVSLWCVATAVTSVAASFRRVRSAMACMPMASNISCAARRRQERFQGVRRGTGTSPGSKGSR